MCGVVQEMCKSGLRNEELRTRGQWPSLQMAEGGAERQALPAGAICSRAGPFSLWALNAQGRVSMGDLASWGAAGRPELLAPVHPSHLPFVSMK